MLENHDIVMLALPRFDGAYESTSHNMAWELTRYTRVLYVDNPMTYTDLLKRELKTQLARRWPRWLGLKSRIIRENKDGLALNVLIPSPARPINFLPEGSTYDWAKRLINRNMARQIKRAAKKLGFKNIIYINSFNFHYCYVQDELQPDLSVYHCVDQIIKPYNLKHGPDNEVELLQRVDAVVSTSKALQTIKGKINPNSHFVPNAAKYEFVHKAVDPATPFADELRDVPHPIIGFFGVIERRMDYELLDELTREHPDWTFAMIGPELPEYVPKWWYERKNVLRLGPKPYIRLPEFLKAFNVGIIPFKVDEVSNTIFPLKLYEYLGAGLPTVCTPFNPDVLNDLGEVVAVAGTPTDFAAALQDALDNDSDDKRQTRFEIAQQNTWQARGRQFAELLQEHVDKKQETP